MNPEIVAVLIPVVAVGGRKARTDASGMFMVAEHWSEPGRP